MIVDEEQKVDLGAVAHQVLGAGISVKSEFKSLV